MVQILSNETEREITMAIRLVVWTMQGASILAGLIGAIWHWESFVCAIAFAVFLETAKPKGL
jgi:hypothetical protein